MGVTWDKTRPGDKEHEKIPFSSGGGRNIIKITDDFRILRDELIAVGCLVKRGTEKDFKLDMFLSKNFKKFGKLG